MLQHPHRDDQATAELVAALAALAVALTEVHAAQQRAQQAQAARAVSGGVADLATAGHGPRLRQRQENAGTSRRASWIEGLIRAARCWSASARRARGVA